MRDQQLAPVRHPGHDRFGCERLPANARDLLTDLTSHVDWAWIVGNHDPGFADHCGGKLADEVELGGIVLRHEAVRDDPRPEMSGHYHPKFRMRTVGITICSSSTGAHRPRAPSASSE